MNEEEKVLQDVPPAPAEEPQERINTMSGFGFAAPEPVFAPPVPVPPAPAPKLPEFNDPMPKPKKKRRSVSLGAFIAVVLVLAILLGCSGFSMFMLYRYCEDLESDHSKLSDDYKELESINKNNETKISELEEKFKGFTGIDSTVESGEHLSPSQIYAMNVNAVVSVACLVSSGPMSGYSTGSGFFITEDGYILTNAHVVDNATEIHILTYDKLEIKAELIGKDSLNDVALLKAEVENYPCVKIGSSANVVVGEQVAAIGNPLGTLSFSLSVGYVSAKDRIINTEGSSTNMIQTDVAINSGNSGGPLFNMAGEVIGITSAKYSGESSSGATIEGISFSIPIDDVKALLPELKETGTISYAYLGVSVKDVLADKDAGTPSGALVVETFPDFAAEEAGILANDIIVKVGDSPVTSVGTLTMALKNYKPDDSVAVVVFRDGAETTITVVLDERPED